MQPEPLFQPSLMAVEPLPSCRLLERPPAASLDVALHRAPAHAELRRDPPRAPAKLLQPQHRRDLIRLHHHIPPRARCPQSAWTESHLFHENPLLTDLPRWTNSSCRQGTTLPCRARADGLS